jgi:hypothetical protein
MFVNVKPREMNIYDSLIKYETKHSNRTLKLNLFTNRNTTLLLDHNELVLRLIALLKSVLDFDIGVVRLTDKQENSTQTENIMLHNDGYEQEKTDREIAFNDLRRDYNNVYIELESLKVEFTKITKEKNELEVKYEKLDKCYETVIAENVRFKEEVDRLKLDNEMLTQKLEDERLLVEDFEKHAGVKENLAKTIESMKTTLQHNTPTLEKVLIKNDKILSICKFLTPLDIINLKHASKRLYSHVDSHTSLSKFLFYTIIKKKNKAINDLKQDVSSEDDIVEHEEIETEALLRKHRQEEVRQYKDYGQSIMNAVEFVCNDIKIQTKRIDNVVLGGNSYIKGVTSLFSGLFNGGQNSAFNGYIIRNGHSSFSTNGKTPSNQSFSDMVSDTLLTS